MKSTNGFTVVELLVVIVVIAILATVSVIAYTSVLDDAYVSRIKTDTANMSKAIKLYDSKYGTPPLCPGGVSGSTCVISQLDLKGYSINMPEAERGDYSYVATSTNYNWAIRAHSHRTDAGYCKVGYYPNYPGWWSTTVDCADL